MTDKRATPLTDALEKRLVADTETEDDVRLDWCMDHAFRLERDRAMLRRALQGTTCYCEEADGDGDAVTCERCAALAATEDKS